MARNLIDAFVVWYDNASELDRHLVTALASLFCAVVIVLLLV